MRDGKARIPTPQEFQRLIAVIGDTTHAERNTAMVLLSYGCGMRACEISSMDLGDVLSASGAIKREFTIKWVNSKTDKPRQVFLENEKVIRAVKDYVTHLRTMGDVHLDGPLFMSQKRQRFTPNVMQMTFAKFYKLAGLEGCKSHSGRRAFITKLLDGGTDIKSVAILVGHQNINQTAEYKDTSPAVLKNISKKAL